MLALPFTAFDSGQEEALLHSYHGHAFPVRVESHRTAEPPMCGTEKVLRGIEVEVNTRPRKQHQPYVTGVPSKKQSLQVEWS